MVCVARRKHVDDRGTHARPSTTPASPTSRVLSGASSRGRGSYSHRDVTSPQAGDAAAAWNWTDDGDVAAAVVLPAPRRVMAERVTLQQLRQQLRDAEVGANATSAATATQRRLAAVQRSPTAYLAGATNADIGATFGAWCSGVCVCVCVVCVLCRGSGRACVVLGGRAFTIVVFVFAISWIRLGGVTCTVFLPGS